MKIKLGIILISVAITQNLLIDGQVRYCMFEGNCGILPNGWIVGVFLFTTSLFEVLIALWLFTDGYFDNKIIKGKNEDG